MKITFLGTGTSQGVPMIGCKCPVCTSINIKDQRLRSSILVETQDTKLVIDTGPDFRQQMLQNNVDTIDGVLYTHEHNDHIAGLDDLRSYNYIKKAPVDIWAEKRVLDTIKRQYPYIFAKNKYPGIPTLNTHQINTSNFTINNVPIIPIKLIHYKLPVLGYRIGNMAYLTDLSSIEQNEIKKLQGLKILIIDALRIEPHISHFNLEQAINLINILNPEHAYLTHISHKLGLHETINNQLPENISPAYDTLKICY